MMRYLMATMMIVGSLMLNGQQDFNLELVAHVPNAEALSDVWGWVDEDGTEYAIIGARTKTEVYSLSDPAAPELVFSVTGASSIWRDIKTLGDFAYVTTDQGADGIVIIDLSDAPDNITSSKVNPMVNGGAIEKCHNLYIDTTSQLMFLAGCNGSDGVLAFDITTDPKNPQLVQEVSTPYAHDVYVRDNIAYASEIFDGEFSIFNIEDIMNPVELGSAKTTNFFTHNAWSNETNEYVYTTDEVPNGTVDAFDITDINNPVKVDVFVPESILGQNVTPHNTHWIDNYLVTSWYGYGVVVSDVSNPRKIIEVGHYDTGSSPNCWGAYPYLPSGLILASDISNGLFVLRPQYERASYAEGVIKDAITGNPIFNASVEIQSTRPLTDRSDPKGQYTVGDLQVGTFNMVVSHPEYLPQTVEVNLVQGETAEVDFILSKEETFMQTVKVVDEGGLPLNEVEVLFTKDVLTLNEMTNTDGEVNRTFAAGEYGVIAGKWGYKYGVAELTFSENGTNVITLERGYEDDFVFDYEWTEEGVNDRGRWVREVPIGTSFGSEESNPSMDVDDDLGDLCYITGNGSGGPGGFDADDGAFTLFSPIMELTEFPDATLTFRPWFFNDGGSGATPNDSYRIYATNGGDKELLMEISENTGGWAEKVTIPLADFISLNDEVQILFETADDEAGHLVEAGLDDFEVVLEKSVAVEELPFSTEWEVFPNPVGTSVNLFNKDFVGQANVKVYNAIGALVSEHKVRGGSVSFPSPNMAGIYVLKISAEEGYVETRKISVLGK